MKPYQERVIAEKQELDAKRDKLVEFFKSDVYKTITEPEQELLRRQCKIMEEYSGILSERIAHFE